MNQKNNCVRVRFAPSPTGYLHIGGLRTAIFNWLFARHNNGVFLIRIEDTDVERSKQEFTDSILNLLEWSGINSDEPVLYQSKRVGDYQKIIDDLLEKNLVYRCFCTAEDLEKRIGSKDLEYRKYDGHCRNLSDEEQDLSKSFVVRFKLPDGRNKIEFNDLIRGHLEFDINQFDDFVILRSDGMPTYNFVVVIDDNFLRVNYILRGEDHISNTPKQILIYEACGFEIPKFGHFPLILGSDGSRLSKRHAATSVEEYRRNGFLSDALFNYLVRLGWSYKDQEIFSKDELVELFDLKNVGKSGAIFDIKKLEWVNSYYIKRLSAENIINLIKKDVDSEFENKISDWSKEVRYGFIDLYKERVNNLKELVKEVLLIYSGPENFYEIEEWQNKEILNNIELVINLLLEEKDFSSQVLSSKIKSLCKQKGLRLPSLAVPIRIALTGKTSSPGIFDLLALLSKEESIRRLKFFRDYLISRV